MLRDVIGLIFISYLKLDMTIMQETGMLLIMFQVPEFIMMDTDLVIMI